MTNLFYKFFLTGVVGNLGSHTRVESLNAGMFMTVFDENCTTHPLALASEEKILGKKPTLMQVDIRGTILWGMLCAPLVPRLS